MNHILLICRKELKSYFASPIAYLLMAFFGLLFGFAFFTATRDFVRFSFQSQMMGQQQPMNVNEQIIEIRELLKALSGDHTIILSTHILSEVEQSCERVIIISQGKLVAQDSVANLTNRLRGAEAVCLEVESADGRPDSGEVQGRLEQVAGVSRVVMKEVKDGRITFEVESLQGRHIRAELARSVVNSGWNLSELRAVGLSLEDIFLQLTTSEKKPEGESK